MIPHGVEIFVGLAPIDLRWGFDRLAGVVQEEIGRMPRGGALFLFFGKRRTALKVLFFDGTGLCLFYKRLDRGTFRMPEAPHAAAVSIELSERELGDLLEGIDVESRTSNVAAEQAPSCCARALKNGLDFAIGSVTPSNVSDAEDRTSSPASSMRIDEMPWTVVELQELLTTERSSFFAERSSFFAERSSFAERVASLEKERDALRAAYERLRQELELWKRRLFVAKAERVDTTQLELEFADKLRRLDELADTLGIARNDRDRDQAHGEGEHGDAQTARDGKPRGKRKKNRGTGRRNLRDLPLEEERIELADPHLEGLVAEGTVVRHGFEESYKLMNKRGGRRRVVLARVRYKTVDAEGKADVITTAMPAEMLPGTMAAPSLAAHIIMENIGKGIFAWVDEQRPLFAEQRGYVRSALEYAHNQRHALVRFFDDGRLVLDNSRSERAIKAVALGRKAWLFCGSDDHAKSTASLFSVIASARLHGIEPEEYLRCLIRLVPLWPTHRMLELAPMFWTRTRERLDIDALAAEFGPIAIPTEPLDTSSTAPRQAAG